MGMNGRDLDPRSPPMAYCELPTIMSTRFGSSRTMLFLTQCAAVRTQSLRIRLPPQNCERVGSAAADRIMAACQGLSETRVSWPPTMRDFGGLRLRSRKAVRAWSVASRTASLLDARAVVSSTALQADWPYPAEGRPRSVISEIPARRGFHGSLSRLKAKLPFRKPSCRVRAPRPRR